MGLLKESLVGDLTSGRIRFEPISLRALFDDVVSFAKDFKSIQEVQTPLGAMEITAEIVRASRIDPDTLNREADVLIVYERLNSPEKRQIASVVHMMNGEDSYTFVGADIWSDSQNPEKKTFSLKNARETVFTLHAIRYVEQTIIESVMANVWGDYFETGYEKLSVLKAASQPQPSRQFGILVSGIADGPSQS